MTIKWMDMGPYPVCSVGLITTRKDWALAQRRYRFADPYPDDSGYTVWVIHRKEHFALVIFNGIRRMARHEAAGLIAHEAVHIWQFICEHIRAGSRTGREIEAYSVQWITTWLAKELRI